MLKILPAKTTDLELVQILRDKVENKGDQQAIKTMTTSQEILKYIKMKYLQNGSMVEAILNTINNMTDHKNICESITNIGRALTIFSAIANAKLNQMQTKPSFFTFADIVSSTISSP